VITELEFHSLAAQGHNRIPLIGEAFADLETPLSLYLKLAGGRPLSFLLESVVGGERFGRYSFIGLPARSLLRATGQHCEVVTDGRVVETHEGNPLDFIEAYQRRFKVALRPACRASAAGWRATSATRRCASWSRSWPRRSARAASARPTSCCCSARSWR
jgi:anthranilate/para-aminobenzoate synthase component I